LNNVYFSCKIITWQQNQRKEERHILKEKNRDFALVAVKKSKNPANSKHAMTAGNIIETTTGKLPTACRKCEENDMRNGKPKAAAPGAEYLSVKNRRILYAQNALINSISIVTEKRGLRNEQQENSRLGDL
jgi:hypothetical protein